MDARLAPAWAEESYEDVRPRRPRLPAFGVRVRRACRGLGRIRNDIAGYVVLLGAGVDPDPTGAGTYSATLPVVVALAPPGSGTLTYHVLVLKQNQFGIRSNNRLTKLVTVDSSGDLILPALLAPDSLVVTLGVGGSLNVRARYPNYANDEYKATGWAVWVSMAPTDPLLFPPVVGRDVTGDILFGAVVPSLSPGTWNVAVALVRQSDGAQSPVVTTSVVIPSLPTAPLPVHGGYDL